MKVATVLALATGALATVIPRDAQDDVLSVIETAGSDIDALTEAAKAYSGDKGPLVEAADKLISDLKAGKETVAAGDDLDASAAVALANPVQELAKKGTALTEALKSRKSDVEAAGECKTVQDQISAISAASTDLIDTVTGKVPENAQDLAKQLAGQLTTVLEDAEASYKDCTDSGNGGGDDSDDGDKTDMPSGGASTEAPKPTGSAKPTGGNGAVTTDCPPAGTGAPMPTKTGMPPVVTGAAAAFAPAGILAAVAAVFAL